MATAYTEEDDGDAPYFWQEKPNQSELDFLKEMKTSKDSSVHKSLNNSSANCYYKESIRKYWDHSGFKNHTAKESSFDYSISSDTARDQSTSLNSFLSNEYINSVFNSEHSGSLKNIPFTKCKVNGSISPSPEPDDEISLLLVSSVQDCKKARRVADRLQACYRFKVVLLQEMLPELHISGHQIIHNIFQELDFIAPLVSYSFLEEINRGFHNVNSDVLDTKYVYTTLFENYLSSSSLNFLCWPLVFEDVKFHYIRYNNILKRGCYLDKLENYVSCLKDAKELECYKEFRRSYSCSC